MITNFRHAPQRVWEIHCHRGDGENRIEELKHDLEIDRTSCASYLANQLRFATVVGPLVEVPVLIGLVHVSLRLGRKCFALPAATQEEATP